MNNTSTIKCSTINEELEALFSAIDREISDDPEAALDLIDVLDDNPEASEEMQEELEVIKSNIQLPPEDDYEMDVANDKEDEEMKEMLALIESEKEKAKEEAQLKKNTEQEEDGDEISKNKRRADDSLPEKQPSKKKTKDSKKKKALTDGGVSIFRGEDLFGDNITNGSKDDLPPPPPPPRPSKVTKAKHTLVGNS